MDRLECWAVYRDDQDQMFIWRSEREADVHMRQLQASGFECRVVKLTECTCDRDAVCGWTLPKGDCRP